MRQHDITLASADSDAATVAAQVLADQSLFTTNHTAQEGLYHVVDAISLEKPLCPGDSADPQDSIFNGALSRFFEAQLVGQVLQQAQLDHLLGVNATLGGPAGAGIHALYEAQLAGVLNQDIGATAPHAAITTDLAAVMAQAAGVDRVVSVSGFQDSLVALQDALSQNALSDWAGGLTGGAGADAAGGLDLPF